LRYVRRVNDDAKTEVMRLTTRGYELAQTGVLPLSAYLRFLEHQRWSTIGRSERLPLRKFFAMGVVRAQGLEVIEQTSFGEELVLTMWLSRVGKTSLAFSHDIHKASGILAARSTATIVALDANRRPAVIDDAARSYLIERPALELERLEFESPPGAYERAVDIRPSDQDLQRHVNHARYADFVEDTRVFASEATGYGASPPDGFPRHLFLAYEREARVGEPVAMATWSTAPRTLDFALKKADGTLVTRARVRL